MYPLYYKNLSSSPSHLPFFILPPLPPKLALHHSRKIGNILFSRRRYKKKKKNPKDFFGGPESPRRFFFKGFLQNAFLVCPGAFSFFTRAWGKPEKGRQNAEKTPFFSGPGPARKPEGPARPGPGPARARPGGDPSPKTLFFQRFSPKRFLGLPRGVFFFHAGVGKT